MSFGSILKGIGDSGVIGQVGGLFQKPSAQHVYIPPVNPVSTSVPIQGGITIGESGNDTIEQRYILWGVAAIAVLLILKKK